MDPNQIGTTIVKKALCESCKAIDSNYYVYTSGLRQPSADGGEWLFDVTCLSYYYDDFLKHVPLVAESEWGTENDIYDDFQKLLLARADVRVIIFDGARSPGYRRIFSILAKYIARHEGSRDGDTYLLVAWTPDKFMFHRIDAFRSQRGLG